MIDSRPGKHNAAGSRLPSGGKGRCNVGATENELARFVRSFPTEKIPPEVMHLAKRCLMNYCGVALYGSRDPSVDVLLDIFDDQGASPQATVIGKMVRTSLLNAALVNGYS